MSTQTMLSRRCSFCKSRGHYSTTCPLKPKGNRCMLFGVNLLQRKQGKPWTREEHRAFLRGLEVYGPSRWKQISENFVRTRTPNQIASHAQKYYLWLKAAANDPEKKSRCSIFQVPAVGRSDSPPIPHVGSSTARVGASETASRARPFANITAANPFFANAAAANIFFANPTAAKTLFANATAANPMIATAAAANPLLATATAAANPLLANATSAANPLPYLCKHPTGHAYAYPYYKATAPINLQHNPSQTYSRPPMPNLPFVRRMYNARRFQSPLCLAPHVYFN